MTDARPPRTRADYTYFREIPTRWRDNDVYGHVNNVVYYELFDTVINRYLIDEGGLDFLGGDVVGITPETRCLFRKPLRYPDMVEGALAVTRLGRSSVVYDIALFRKGEDDPAAEGHFVHVFVERTRQDRTCAIPPRIRAALERLVRARAPGAQDPGDG